MTKAKEMINEMYKQAAGISSEKEETRKAALKHTMQTSNSNKIQAFIHLTKNEVPVLHENLDDKPFLLNTQTGTVDLKNGILKEQERDDLLTKRINFGICKRKPIQWINFLNDIFMGDQNLIRFVQKAAGYSLTGDISEQCMFILYGTGRNGKSTFLNVLSDIFGDYACNTPAETLMIKKNDTIPNDIARLKGMRFVTAYETEDNKRLAEAKIKALTGGDIITARFMRGEYFQFKPTFKLWLATNHKPRIKGTDEGIWRRIKLIPFNYCVPKDKMDKHLQEKLMAEAEEILTWAIEGTNIWEKEGLGEAEAVTLATNEYRSESDAIGLFLKEKTEKDLSSYYFKRDLFHRYKLWAEDAGEYLLSERYFNNAMKERGYQTAKRGQGGRVCWLGIKAKNQNEKQEERYHEEEFD
jgi:putative DNA primase/helicase